MRRGSRPRPELRAPASTSSCAATGTSRKPARVAVGTSNARAWWGGRGAGRRRPCRGDRRAPGSRCGRSRPRPRCRRCPSRSRRPRGSQRAPARAGPASRAAQGVGQRLAVAAAGTRRSSRAAQAARRASIEVAGLGEESSPSESVASQPSRSVSRECPAGVLEHRLHPDLRRGQPLPGGAEPGDAFFEQRERGVEVEVVGLELPDDLLQAGELVGESTGGRQADRLMPAHRARGRPRRVTRRRNGAPGANRRGAGARARRRRAPRRSPARGPERTQRIELAPSRCADGAGGEPRSTPACSRSAVRASRSATSSVAAAHAPGEPGRAASHLAQDVREIGTARSAAAEGVRRGRRRPDR